MSNQTPDHEFDRTPQGQALAALLRRNAPPPSNAAAGAAGVLLRLQQQTRQGKRFSLLHWLAPAAGIAAAAVIVVLAALPDDTRVPAPTPVGVTPVSAPRVVRGPVQPGLRAVVRGTSGNGWRLDAGLKDGLRVGDTLHGKGGIAATVVAAGIFDSRVRIDSAETRRGDEFFIDSLNARQDRAARLAELGGDPGAFLDFGAIFDPLPMREAKLRGLNDGRAIGVQEVIPSILREFAGQPQPTLAAQLGLRAGDVLESVNGMQVRNLNDLATALGYSRSGQITMTVLRGSAAVELRTN